MNQYETASTGSSSMNFLFGVLVGAVAGAGVALLLAPKSGAELRSDLGHQMNTMKDTASRRIREMKDRAGAAYNDATRTAERQI